MNGNLWPRANPPIVEDEIAKREKTSWSADWIRAVSVVPNADPFPNGVVEGFKQPDVAVPTRSSRKRQPHHLGRHHFYSISPVYRGQGLRPFSDLPRLAEMPPSLASVSH